MEELTLTYEAALDYIASFGRFGSRPGLERMHWMLERMDCPLSQGFIHIGGTNGKGSTTAFVHNILQAAGYRVGMYTSPYIENFTDRIRAGGQDIDAPRLAAIVERLQPLLEEVNASDLGPITQFEVTTLVALAYYQELDLDFVVWEVGLGGRLDATNVVTPLVSVITNIAHDHTEVLGETLPEIAAEKAGIIKRQVPVVTAVQEEAALAVIEKTARAMAAPLWRIGRDFRYRRRHFSLQEQSFDYQDHEFAASHLRLGLLGEHQCKNAATALAIISLLRKAGYEIDGQACRWGLETTLWPGRLEILSRKPLVLVDGAHNTHGTRALGQAIKEYFPAASVVMILGILQDKKRDEMLAHLLPLASRVIFTAPDYGRAIDPKILLAEAAAYSLPATSAATVPAAIDLALQAMGEKEILLIAGSLYTVAEARDYMATFQEQ